MSHRFYARATYECPCGGVSTRIMKKNPLKVCARCGIGTIPPKRGISQPPIFVAKEDVPLILAGSHIVNNEGEVVPAA